MVRYSRGRAPISVAIPRSPGCISLGNTSTRRRTRGSGLTANLGSIGATYNLTMDPYEKYDMIFNGAAPTRVLTSSPGRYAGQDNGWVLSLIEPVIIEFDKTIMKYPNIKRSPGGASNDVVPNFRLPKIPSHC